MNEKKDTSWQNVSKWYSGITKGSGHYYHSHVVLPNALRLLDLKPDSSLLDLACGSGVLANSIPEEVKYLGVDIASSLIAEAKSKDKNSLHKYLVSDATHELKLDTTYSHAAIILAIQNMNNPEMAIQNVASHLNKFGTLVIVMNHPAFRIPRQSSWGVDQANKMQYRRIDRYMTEMEIPIKAHPGQGKSPITWSYHKPLSYYTKILSKNGFVIEELEEWVSDKESQGKAKKMEDRARNEFPLFLAIKATHAVQNP